MFLVISVQSSQSLWFICRTAFARHINKYTDFNMSVLRAADSSENGDNNDNMFHSFTRDPSLFFSIIIFLSVSVDRTRYYILLPRERSRLLSPNFSHRLGLAFPQIEIGTPLDRDTHIEVRMGRSVCWCVREVWAITKV